MKTMMKTLAKTVAKWLLGYLPDVALWAVKYGADKAADEEKVAYVLCVVKEVASTAALVARTMEDGEVTAQEEQEVQRVAFGLSEQLKGLL